MNQDTYNMDHETYLEYCNAISRHIPWLKSMIKKTRKNLLTIDIYEIYDYFGVNFVGKNPAIYQSVRDILLEEGIIITLGNNNGVKFLGFSCIKVPMIYMPGHDDIDKFHTFLKDNKLYNEENGYLVCPECNRYTVKYSVDSYSNNSTWWCEHCIKDIIYYGYDLEISDKDKYHIYKLWGIDALSVLTNESVNKSRKFVASYFKECCINKKDKCLYFDFFKDKEKNNEMGQEIENGESEQ